MSETRRGPRRSDCRSWGSFVERFHRLWGRSPERSDPHVQCCVVGLTQMPETAFATVGVDPIERARSDLVASLGLTVYQRRAAAGF
jgi:hypothetical protein